MNPLLAAGCPFLERLLHHPHKSHQIAPAFGMLTDDDDDVATVWTVDDTAIGVELSPGTGFPCDLSLRVGVFEPPDEFVG